MMFGPTSRSGHADDRGTAERDADYRRGGSSDRNARLPGDDRYGASAILPPPPSSDAP